MLDSCWVAGAQKKGSAASRGSLLAETCVLAGLSPQSFLCLHCLLDAKGNSARLLLDAWCREEGERSVQGECPGGDLRRQLSVRERPPGEGAGRGARRGRGGSEAAQGPAAWRQHIACRSACLWQRWCLDLQVVAMYPDRTSGRLPFICVQGVGCQSPCSSIAQLLLSAERHEVADQQETQQACRNPAGKFKADLPQEPSTGPCMAPVCSSSPTLFMQGWPQVFHCSQYRI